MSWRSHIRPKLFLLDLGSRDIFEQLQIEETLLRSSQLNVCLLNRGSSRAIVMGISGQPELVIDIDRVKRDQIPVIQRFSGGGTVIVDEDTLFITFLFQKECLPIQPFPEPILRWSGELYAASWEIPSFHLIENDYAIGSLKCGGNAQYIRKDRWLHHTSFLWDFKQSNMDYLLFPSRRPRYRADRSHGDFLCKLKEFAPSKEILLQQLCNHLSNHFHLIPMKEHEIPSHTGRQSLRRLVL